MEIKQACEIQKVPILQINVTFRTIEFLKEKLA